MNTISNPLMNLQSAPGFRQSVKGNSKSLIGNSNTSQMYHQAAAMNDLARRHYAQTISRATNLSHLQFLNRYHQQQQQLYCVQPNQAAFALEAPLSPVQQQQKYATFNQRHPMESLMGAIERQALLNKPLCRCRVMYLGSSVPHITKNGLHGIQEPLRHLYPDEQFNSNSSSSSRPQGTSIDISYLSADLGIDSWLSVWSNGLLLENVDEFGREIKRFFSIESLHYCAAVRFFDASSLVNKDEQQQQPPLPVAAESTKTKAETSDQNNNQEEPKPALDDDDEEEEEEEAKLGEQQPIMRPAQKSLVRFLPLDAPLFQCPGMVDTKHPPMFSAIMRRTSGIKVLECHAFICRRDAAANALVRCCTHAYADLLSARRMSSSSVTQLVDQFGQQAQPPSAAAARQHLYKPNNQLGGTTNHLSLARRGRHLDGRQRRQTKQDVVAAAAAAGPNGGQAAKHSGHNSASSDDTPSSLCEGREGTNSTNSGDDNYAIISRHQSRANSRDSATISVPAKRSATRKMKQVGSSKSLFDDFMPNVTRTTTTTTTSSSSSAAAATAAAALATGDAGASSENAKLMAHSMDLLRLQDDDYDCASQQTKRHSKSMQNLLDFSYQHRPLHNRAGSFSSSRASLVSGVSSSGRATGRRRHRLVARDQRSKRSLQDIRNQVRPELDLGLSPPAAAADPLRGERLSQGQLVRGDGLQQQQQAIYDKPMPTASMNYYERIEARKSATTANNKKRDRSRTRANNRPDSGSSSANTRRASGGAAFEQHQSPMAYAAPSLAHQLSAHHHLPPMPMPMPMSMPMSMPVPLPLPLPISMAAYPPMQPLEAAAYYGGTLLKYPAGYCLPPQPIHYDFRMPAAAYGQQQHRHLENTLAAAQAHYVNSPMAAAPTSSSMAGTLATLSHGKRNRQHVAGQTKCSSSSLATRFRCLSPPLNFISGSAPRAATDAKEHRRSAILRRPASTETKSQEGVRDAAAGPISISSDELTSVVSAKPGFISHSSASGASSGFGCAGPANNNSPRLSWLKRLSQTMSGGGGGHSPQQPAASEHFRQDERSGQATKQQKKRSSRLFVGSLTLGRATTRNKQQQQTALVTSS